MPWLVRRLSCDVSSQITPEFVLIISLLDLDMAAVAQKSMAGNTGEAVKPSLKPSLVAGKETNVAQSTSQDQDVSQEDLVFSPAEARVFTNKRPNIVALLADGKDSSTPGGRGTKRSLSLVSSPTEEDFIVVNSNGDNIELMSMDDYETVDVTVTDITGSSGQSVQVMDGTVDLTGDSSPSSSTGPK